ncbi:MAG: SUF system NifU family Fe-S cluster assembly protein [Deltaproteobacteria bacterium]|jgi:nitrogen fixation NifU-like protein|nr:SUF system NifU family Fe-S cluster assembly protein [Deltaproteobacteria bacterium]
MDDLRQLYQETILDHGRRPRNFGAMDDATHQADGYNPLCGDKVHLYLKVNDGVVEELKFEGQGCAISTSSASLMTEALKGRSVQEARDLFARVHAMLTGKQIDDEAAKLGKLAVFEGVKKYPLRVKCATLAWHTLENALAGGGEVAKTE